jgi:hypothetical protein
VSNGTKNHVKIQNFYTEKLELSEKMRKVNEKWFTLVDFNDGIESPKLHEYT